MTNFFTDCDKLYNDLVDIELETSFAKWVADSVSDYMENMKINDRSIFVHPERIKDSNLFFRKSNAVCINFLEKAHLVLFNHKKQDGQLTFFSLFIDPLYILNKEYDKTKQSKSNEYNCG